MQVQFQTTIDDYNRFLNYYYLKRNFVRRFIILLIFPIVISSFKDKSQPFDLSLFILKSVIVACILIFLFALLPYITSKITLWKSLKKYPILTKRTLIIQDDGITITTEDENTTWKWEALKNVEIIGDYLFINLYTNKFYIIPLHAFATENDAINFGGVLNNGIQQKRGVSQPRKIRNLYYWGLLGFIPNFGAIAGIVLAIKGIQYKNVKLVVIGIAAILFTFFFWMFLLPKLNPRGFTDISQMQLNSLVKNVEFYKLQHGQYPDSLQQLLKDDKLAAIHDAIQIDHKRSNIYYFYQPLNDKYYLFSRGQDGISHTQDDLYPKVNVDSGRIGLIIPK